MEIDVKALDLLPAVTESSLQICLLTCVDTCEYSCWITI